MNLKWLILFEIHHVNKEQIFFLGESISLAVVWKINFKKMPLSKMNKG
jgi:hypothetical protein